MLARENRQELESPLHHLFSHCQRPSKEQLSWQASSLQVLQV